MPLLIKSMLLAVLLPGQFGSAATNKYRYKTSGFGASSDFYWSEEGCSLLGSSANIVGQDQVYKYKSNGKPSESASEYISVYFDIWSGCTATSASHSYLVYYPYDDSGTTMSVNTDQANLATASISSSGEAYVAKEVCDIECFDWDEDGQTDYCYPSNCNPDPACFLPIAISVNAEFNAVGPIETQKFTSSYRTVDGFYRSTSTDRSRPAAPISFVIDLGGEDVFEVPANAETSARIFKTKSGDVSVYRGL